MFIATIINWGSKDAVRTPKIKPTAHWSAIGDTPEQAGVAAMNWFNNNRNSYVGIETEIRVGELTHIVQMPRPQVDLIPAKD